MKRKISLTILLLFCIAATAQDVITTKDGEDIQAKVLEITQTDIKYKKYSNPDGPIYSISKSEVLIVRYENGEKEVFKDITKNYKPNTTYNVKEGMSYSEYKDFYDKKMYVHQLGDPYNPSGAGVASFFIPGLGQGIADEWGRGALFFLANLGLGIGSGITYYGMLNYREPYKTNNTYYFLIITATRLAIDIWSITDAVKIAKVKNMYNQDIRGKRTAQLDCTLTPFITTTPTLRNDNTAITGLSLNFSF